MTNEDLLRAMTSESLPCNPLPFLNHIHQRVKEEGTDFIKSDECKRALWIINAQAYNQCVPGEFDEWLRLTESTPKTVEV